MQDNCIIQNVRKYLYQNIYELDSAKFRSHNDEREKIRKLIQCTSEYGEANSALIIGPRGSGKTALVKDVLEEFTWEKSFSDNSILVRLNGLIHTNDNLALRSITRQLNLVNVVEGRVFGSFAENLAFLLISLKEGQKDISKSVIFVLEEFDLFCTHHNQTLLYNLFDISQSAQTAICVLGITCRLDVMELLEKRIKSRFSHRQIFVFSEMHCNDKEMLEFRLENIKDTLSLRSSKSSRDISSSYKSNWNKNIQCLIKDKEFKNIIQRIIDIDNSKNCLRNILICIISNLQDDHDSITVTQFQEQLDKLEKDETVKMLQDLNTLEFCLIIAMKHHSDIYNNQPMNFEMIFTRYVKFANANASIQAVQRPVVMKAFEHLQNLELISFINAAGSKLQKEYQMFKLVSSPQQIAEAVKISTELPTEVIQWANSSLF